MATYNARITGASKVKTTYGNIFMSNEQEQSGTKAHPVDTLVTCAELKHICDTVVELTKIRAAGCSHLAVENFAPVLMAKLLAEFSMHKKGMMQLYTSDL